jgi:hypothetical protein
LGLLAAVFCLNGLHDLGHAWAHEHGAGEHADHGDAPCDLCAWDWAVATEPEPKLEVPTAMRLEERAAVPADWGEAGVLGGLAERRDARGPPRG